MSKNFGPDVRAEMERRRDLFYWFNLGQIFEMDDDDNQEFSTAIIYDFWNQWPHSLQDMKTACETRDLDSMKLTANAVHGSSSVLGAAKIEREMKRLKNLADCRDEWGEQKIGEADALKKIEEILAVVEVEAKETMDIFGRYVSVTDTDSV